MALYVTLKTVHEVGAILLLLAGVWIALFTIRAHVSADTQAIAETANDMLTAAVVVTVLVLLIQPATGGVLMAIVGYDRRASWLVLALILYAVGGALWLLLLWLQVGMRAIARSSASAGASLPRHYYGMFRIWCVLGVLTFAVFAALFWVMTVKPALF